MELAEMETRFNEYKDCGYAGNRLGYARKDDEKMLHVRLVPWGELDDVSEKYIELANIAYEETSDEDRYRETYARSKETDFKKYNEGIVVRVLKSFK